MDIHKKLDDICIKHHGELLYPNAEEAANNLSEAFNNLSDAEILQKVKENYGDEKFLANKVRKIFNKVTKKYGFKK